MQLSINHLRERAKITSLQKQARDAITAIIQHNESTDEEEDAIELDQ